MLSLLKMAEFIIFMIIIIIIIVTVIIIIFIIIIIIIVVVVIAATVITPGTDTIHVGAYHLVISCYLPFLTLSMIVSAILLVLLDT